jgi:hypothetical protein
MNGPLWPVILHSFIPIKLASNEIGSDIHNNYFRKQDEK